MTKRKQSMSKHTLGPWIADGNGFEMSYNVSDATGALNINIPSKADALLIAAAPELLEGCQLAFDYLLSIGCKPGDETYDYLHNALKKAIPL